MTPVERLILYVVQRIRDEDAFPSRTKLLKILYLIDVEHFRKHRMTLSGWEWVYYHFGPYVHAYPQLLERLSISDLQETEDSTPDGKSFYGYQVTDHQDISDLVSHSDQVTIDEIIERWALEDLNLLLNHVYFRTEPMMDAKPGDVLDFHKIGARSALPSDAGSGLTVSEESRTTFRARLAESRKALEDEAALTNSLMAEHPFRADSVYRNWMENKDLAETRRFPEGHSISLDLDQDDDE
jgi:hypothetical protein